MCVILLKRELICLRDLAHWLVPPSKLLSISPSLPPYQSSTEHAVPTSLLSADGEEKEGEGKTERERRGGRESCLSLLHQRQHHCHTSFRHRKTTRKTFAQQRLKKDITISSSSSSSISCASTYKAKAFLPSQGTGIKNYPRQKKLSQE